MSITLLHMVYHRPHEIRHKTTPQTRPTNKSKMIFIFQSSVLVYCTSVFYIFRSLSFVLSLASMAFLLLAIFYILIDVLKLWNGSPFFYPGNINNSQLI